MVTFLSFNGPVVLPAAHSSPSTPLFLAQLDTPHPSFTEQLFSPSASPPERSIKKRMTRRARQNRPQQRPPPPLPLPPLPSAPSWPPCWPGKSLRSPSRPPRKSVHHCVAALVPPPTACPTCPIPPSTCSRMISTRSRRPRFRRNAARRRPERLHPGQTDNRRQSPMTSRGFPFHLFWLSTFTFSPSTFSCFHVGTTLNLFLHRFFFFRCTRPSFVTFSFQFFHFTVSQPWVCQHSCYHLLFLHKSVLSSSTALMIRISAFISFQGQ